MHHKGLRFRKSTKKHARPPARSMVVSQLLETELSHVPKDILAKYASLLVQAGFNCKRALQLASLDDFEKAGLSRGHARQLHDVWNSSNSSGSESSSDNSSTDSD